MAVDSISRDRPWLFVDTEMLRLARMLSQSRLGSDLYGLAKSVFELTVSRFLSPKHSIRIFTVFSPEPAYKIWRRGGNAGSLKQCIALKAMLLATGFFGDADARIIRTDPPFRSPASGGYYHIRLKAGKRHISLDPWAWNWGIQFGGRLTDGKGSDAIIPDVRGEWTARRQTGMTTLYVIE